MNIYIHPLLSLYCVSVSQCVNANSRVTIWF